MNRFSREQIIAGVATILFLACGGLYWYVYAQLGTLHDDLATMRSDQAVLLNSEEHYEALVSFLDETEQGRSELEGYLPSFDDPTPFLNFIEELGRSAGVSITFDKLVGEVVGENEEDEDEARVGERHVIASLSIEGTWASVYHVMTLFEHMPYITNIDDLVLRKSDSNADLWLGQVHMRVLVR